ncbi:TetR/AcrR family transcriptional regulator [Nocardioides sp. CER19]|uniref:TetR/AcrR family transcriptional regulator n=1 Tax=Nocardioides sp. CER19 TaxID=3038538 RepID=UPI00244AB768|nr:TetR/AcrR family transcriptional regulator [Nocardioides sp. CER19]MDH2412739.1 TetR/AcrR family transcriptional regulator [Nocardioides sp. CER19]
MSTMNIRMPAEERRELILQAATRAFAAGGYAGTSTDAVAKEAGVSQPYVVRMFGTKLDLFLAVLDRTCGRIDAAFRGILEEGPFDPASEDDKARMGHTYTMLLADSDLLHVLMHGFAAASVPEIGDVARAGMGTIFATLQETGWPDEEVRDFVAYGMLLNVLLSMGAFGTEAGPLGDLVASCLPDDTSLATYVAEHHRGDA